MSGTAFTRAPLYDVLVVGGGPAGLAAALAARGAGAQKVLLLERNHSLGGILNQCIHNGFGLHHFKQELTGPEYAERFIREVAGCGIEVLCDCMVLEIRPDKTVHAIHPAEGYLQLAAKAVVLAMGCRERTRGAIGIPGTRPAGVFTAGAAQLYMNIEGFHVGRRAVILGSGDIGLIMARRLTLEGATVLGVYEMMPYSGGLTRNIVQCLQDYGIPLHLSHTITEIRGRDRVQQVVVQRVDEDRRPVPGTQQVIDCDTVLLSVGLIPENELSRQAGVAIDARTGGPLVYENRETSLPGVFACGNVAHVHDLVDFVTAESQLAGAAAAAYCAVQPGGREAPAEVSAGAETAAIAVQPGEGVGYTLPQRIRPAAVGKVVEVFFRATRIFGPCRIEVRCGEELVARYPRERMTPGEMEKVALPAAKLAGLAGRPLVVTAVETGGESTVSPV